MRYKLLSGPGSHPELGDVVYQGDDEIGDVEFFYARTGAATWSVKITDWPTDPVEVAMADVKDGERLIGRRFVLAGLAPQGDQPNVTATTELGTPSVTTQDHQES